MSLEQNYDVVIVGGGAIGAAALHFLAKKGVTRTALLEQRPNFARGATGAWGSLLRQYGALPFYVEHSHEALRYYREEFAKDTDTKPTASFLQTGALYFLGQRQQASFASAYEKIQRQTTYPLSILDAVEGRRLFPEFQWFDDDKAVYEPFAGLACPYTVTEGWIDRAKREGATAQTGMKIVKILVSGNKVRGVKCASGEVINCEQLVLAAGPWTRELLEPLGVHLPLIARPLQLNRFRYERSSGAKELPFFLDGTSGTFGRPMLDGSFLGGYILEEETLASQFRQPLNIRQAAEAKRRLAKRLKCLRTATLVGGLRAIESYTLDEKPFLGHTQKYPNLFVAAGWCCTGFALAPVFGKSIASKVIAGPETATAEATKEIPCPQIA